MNRNIIFRCQYWVYREFKDQFPSYKLGNSSENFYGYQGQQSVLVSRISLRAFGTLFFIFKHSYGILPVFILYVV